jgi:hypothetical protein
VFHLDRLAKLEQTFDTLPGFDDATQAPEMIKYEALTGVAASSPNFSHLMEIRMKTFPSLVVRSAQFLLIVLMVGTSALWAQQMDHGPGPDASDLGERYVKLDPKMPSNGHTFTTTCSGGAAVCGSWTAPTSLNGVVAIHSVLLHTGKVLSWWYPLGKVTQTPYAIYDPVAKTVTNSSFSFAGDFFCSGQTVLPDGRVFVTGGLFDNPMPHNPDDGIKLSAIYDPVADTWTQGPNMSFARWYPTNVEEANGKVMVLTGKDQNAAIVLQSELYDPVANTFTTLPTTANLPQGTDTYVKMKAMPNGKLFLAGSNTQSEYFNPLTNVWTNVATLNFGPRYHGASIIVPGTAAKPLQQVMDVGGTQTFSGGNPTPTWEIINLASASPVWTLSTGSNNLNIARYNANLVILADGNLLYVGGATDSKYTNPIMTPELFNFATSTWSEMADQTAARSYHSTALLLPDGTVYSAGSDDPTYSKTTDETYEIYSPPYLFNSTGGPSKRPTITSSPSTLTYAQQFTISTPNAANIKSVALVKPAATTHDNDMDQRYVPLVFTSSPGQLTVTAPTNANFAPPGYYMIVIVSVSGVPSVMPFTQLCPSTGCI